MATEIRVDIDDIPMDGMKQAEAGDAKVLFVRDTAGIRAFQASCPHYGAPLAKGAICDGTLYCPWHKAAFAIADGALLEPPALEPLKRFPVKLDGAEAVATLEPKEAKSVPKRLSDKVFVIVGTGAAAVSAATTLRREGFAGKILMVGREGGQPYDRPKLSKSFLSKKTEPSATALESDFYGARDIEYVAGPAKRIEPKARRVTLEGGRTMTGDALLIATGSKAAMPVFEGGDLDAVFTLRSLADAVAISAAADGAKAIVVVGGGFIGLEAAAFLTKRGLKATVAAPEALPFASRFGDEVAQALKAYHESNGLTFVQGKVARLEGRGSVEAVHLEGGQVLPADMVLIGAGAKPESDAFEGVEIRDDGALAVDTHLRLAPGVWLAGDIAAFPDAHESKVVRIEHWRLAEQHGAHAARGMMGHESPFVGTPFFWSNQGDKRLDYAGHASDWDRIVTYGDVAKLDFISYYIKDGKALAACAIGHNPHMIAYIHALDKGRAPTVEELMRAGG